MTSEYETLRWPTNLDRAGIEKRLVEVRDYARANGLEDIAARFDNLPAMTPAQLGAAVVASLNVLQDKPEHRQAIMPLEMVAMNLKNLK